MSGAFEIPDKLRQSRLQTFVVQRSRVCGPDGRCPSAEKSGSRGHLTRGLQELSA